MVRIGWALSFVSGKQIRHPQSSVSLRFEAAIRMPEYLHTHQCHLDQSKAARRDLPAGLRPPVVMTGGDGARPMYRTLVCVKDRWYTEERTNESGTGMRRM